MSILRSTGRSLAVLLAIGGIGGLPRAVAQTPGPSAAAEPQFGTALGRLLTAAIGSKYEKRQDWGRTRRITVGLRTEGQGFRMQLRRRKKDVPHGTWKHYRIEQRAGQGAPQVAVEELGIGPDRQLQFRLRVRTQLDYWARAKVYQYGVHLIALEAQGNADVTVALQGTCGLVWGSRAGMPVVGLRPNVTTADLTIHDFRLERISNAHGPLIHELGEAVQRLIEHEYQGPVLTERINRAIAKQQDELELSLAELVTHGWQDLLERKP
jgi:hypothetical protein